MFRRSPQPNDDRPLTSNLTWLYTGRALRSFGTAFLTVAFPLYLAQRHESAAAVGAILTLGSLIGPGMVGAVGIVGDRFGRRPVLIGVGLVGVIGALALAVSSNVVVVVIASGLGGIGRGGGAGTGGAFGPYFPAEQPLLAASVPSSQRTRAFGQLGFIGVLAAAAGSVVAGVPDLLRQTGMSWTSAYQVVFLMGALVSLLVALASVPLREHRPLERDSVQAASDRSAPDAGRHNVANGAAPTGLSTRQLIGRFGLANAINGLGFGFLGPLLTYWFHVRFGVGPAEVGILYTVVNIAGALPFLGAHRISARVGAVRAVVVTRTASIVMLATMAIVPGFFLAGLFLTLRTVFNSLGLPARQSYEMGAVDERRRGTVAALGQLPSMFTSSISPAVGGAVMDSFVDVPIVGAVVFMSANVLTYYLAFRNAPLPGESLSNRSGRAEPEPAED